VKTSKEVVKRVVLFDQDDYVPNLAAAGTCASCATLFRRRIGLFADLPE
jgi:hypothetical protein